VASRILAVLYAFDEQHPRLTLTELARRAALPVPTAHRFATELVAGGALVRRPTGEYVIGRKLWDVGVLAPVHTGLRETASPFLNDIHAATRATVHMAIRDGLQVLYVDRLAGRASVPVVSTIGSRLPMHSTGVGKVLLAHAPEDVQEQALANLSRITPYTITQPHLLRQQLARIRRDGYATTSEEMSLGACSIAVPIRTRSPGDAEHWPVVAAVGVVVASLKRDKTRLLTALQVAAQGISRSLSAP
jgi:DNA-binding IclR family transcriptional regulator